MCSLRIESVDADMKYTLPHLYKSSSYLPCFYVSCILDYGSATFAWTPILPDQSQQCVCVLPSSLQSATPSHTPQLYGESEQNSPALRSIFFPKLLVNLTKCSCYSTDLGTYVLKHICMIVLEFVWAE